MSWPIKQTPKPLQTRNIPPSFFRFDGWGGGLISLILLFVILACGTPPSGSDVIELTAVVDPTAVAVEPIMPGGTVTAPPPDTGWLPIAPGFEQRLIEHDLDERGGPSEAILLLRFDPALYRFEVGYRPGAPQTLAGWRQESGAVALINGGFFTPEWIATGLIISEGQPSGTSYSTFAGMVAIQNGVPAVRSLARTPYDPSEPLEGGLQSFPLLILEGQAAPSEVANNRDTARRAVIAQDREGRIVLLATRRGFFTLPELSRYLAASDLDLEIALNLDGGSSTGLIWQVKTGEPYIGVRPLTPLPAVILVYPR